MLGPEDASQKMGFLLDCNWKFGADELKTVGDKVCETRGAPKPASTAELRVDSSCTPLTEMRGSSPTAQCLAQWATPAPTDAPWAPEDLTLLDESFAKLDLAPS